MSYWQRSQRSEYLSDCTIDDAPTREARRSLQKGDWGSVNKFLAECQEVNQRAHALEAIADWPDEYPPFMRWAESNKDASSLTAMAIHRMKWSWSARGGGFASSVGPGAMNSFAQRLAVAKEALQTAASANPRDASVVPWMLWWSRGTGDSALGERAFREGVRRAPSLRMLYSSMLLSYCAKWGGSNEQMFAFARETASSAPTDSLASTVLAEAHYYAVEVMDGTSEQLQAYWKQPQVRSDLIEAHTRCKSASMQNLNGIRCRNWLAYGLWRCGETSLAREHFEAIGKGMNERPWGGYRKGFNWLLNPFGRAKRACR